MDVKLVVACLIVVDIQPHISMINIALFLSMLDDISLSQVIQ
jgi:hypothetical protein